MAPLIDPSTGEIFAEAPVSGPADVDRAVRAAAEAFSSWKRTTPSERRWLSSASPTPSRLGPRIWSGPSARTRASPSS